jgi:hypothetical protein
VGRLQCKKEFEMKAQKTDKVVEELKVELRHFFKLKLVSSWKYLGKEDMFTVSLPDRLSETMREQGGMQPGELLMRKLEAPDIRVLMDLLHAEERKMKKRSFK